MLEQVSFGQEFVTDVLQLQFLSLSTFDGDDPSFALSLSYAVVEGAAEVLEVPSTDINTTVSHTSELGSIPPIVVYDNVPGGAGLVARLELEDVLMQTLHMALKRVQGACGCAPETSCYGYLRSYSNQFTHEKLQRNPVKQYLESILGFAPVPE